MSITESKNEAQEMLELEFDVQDRNGETYHFTLFGAKYFEMDEREFEGCRYWYKHGDYRDYITNMVEWHKNELNKVFKNKEIEKITKAHRKMNGFLGQINLLTT